jgi:hypothetical protein
MGGNKANPRLINEAIQSGGNRGVTENSGRIPLAGSYGALF